MIWAFYKNSEVQAVRTIAEIGGEPPTIAIFAGYVDNVHSDVINTPRYREAIDVAKSNGAPIILFRLLFNPTRDTHGSQIARLTDDDHYEERITLLKAEAKEMNIEWTGFETEAYGEPLAGYMQGSTFTAASAEACYQTCERATNGAGRVDYITPAGTYKKNHPYMSMAWWLAYHRISQTTYYDRPKVIGDIKYPYDIAGRFVNTHSENTPSDKVFWTPQSLADRGGSEDFLWTEWRDIEVARAMQ